MLPVPDRTEAAEFFFTYIDQVPVGDIREVLQAQLAATVDLFSAVPEGGNPFTVRALAYITAGHAGHHSRILRERYLDGAG